MDTQARNLENSIHKGHPEIQAGRVEFHSMRTLLLFLILPAALLGQNSPEVRIAPAPAAAHSTPVGRALSAPSAPGFRLFAIVHKTGDGRSGLRRRPSWETGPVTPDSLTKVKDLAPVGTADSVLSAEISPTWPKCPAMRNGALRSVGHGWLILVLTTREANSPPLLSSVTVSEGGLGAYQINGTGLPSYW